MIKKQVVITGMHRSGTSMLANWLKACGLNVGSNLVGNNSSNPYGHFEDWEFVDIHNIAVNNEGTYLFEKALSENLINNIKEKAKPLINQKNKTLEHWGFKDPRTCMFLEMYEELLDNPVYVFIYRNYSDASNSYFNRELLYNRKNNIKRYFNWVFPLFKKRIRKRYIKSWILHNTNIINHIKTSKNPCFLIEFDDLKSSSAFFISAFKKELSFLNEVNFNDKIEKEGVNKKFKSRLYNDKAEKTLTELRNLKLNQFEFQE
jgi:hypothetical protein